MRRFRQFLKRSVSRRKPDQVSQPTQQQAPMQAPDQPHGGPNEPQPPSQPETRPQEPIAPQSVAPAAAATGKTLTVNLVNRSTSSSVYATLSGRALDQNNALILLQADGRTPYLPSNPPAVQSKLSANVAIRLGPPGSTTTLTVPHIAGGRIYFSINTPLTFFLNPGPALVEPSVTNPSDPNINIHWTFCEFTFNTAQLYANISYVDFVSSVPLALNLSTLSNQNLSVAGLKSNGLDLVASALQTQRSRDNKPWDSLIVKTPQGRNLRVLSPNLGRVGNPSLFQGYFDNYVNQVYSRYATRPLHIDTQAGFGVVSATTSNNDLVIASSSHRFAKPSTADIFSCSTGPFATGSNQEVNAIIPRLAAAFNRSTLLKTDRLPADQNLYYQEGVTNHYSRVVHEANVDGRGYAFPYDDVQPTGGRDASGAVWAGDPRVWEIIVAGSGW